MCDVCSKELVKALEKCDRGVWHWPLNSYSKKIVCLTSRIHSITLIDCLACLYFFLYKPCVAGLDVYRLLWDQWTHCINVQCLKGRSLYDGFKEVVCKTDWFHFSWCHFVCSSVLETGSPLSWWPHLQEWKQGSIVFMVSRGEALAQKRESVANIIYCAKNRCNKKKKSILPVTHTDKMICPCCA